MTDAPQTSIGETGEGPAALSDRRLSLALELEEAVVREYDLVSGEVFSAGFCPGLEGCVPMVPGRFDHVHPTGRDRYEEDLARLTRSRDRFRLDYRMATVDPNAGRQIWASTAFEFVRDPTGAPIRLLTVTKNISQQKAKQQRIESLAYRDPLTGLANRAMFQSVFSKAAEQAEREETGLGLIIIDIDRFKEINDALGLDAGDALLGTLAEQMLRAFRASDIICRLGGDEFAIILPGAEKEADLVRPVKMLQAMLDNPLAQDGCGVPVTASIGAALHRPGQGKVRQLLKNADIALGHAKRGGRNRIVVFESQMRSEVEERQELLRDVRAAIGRDEFILYYQPVVSTHEGRVVGLEALMRWAHPQKGVLTPAAFYPAFDDPHLAVQLGEACIDQSLKQMRAWLDDGVDFGRVAINIASAQMHTGRLASDIAEKLKAYGVPPERLTIEVTENVSMGWASGSVGDTVRALHRMGVTIALDDFGTGYASLINLRQFPIDRLKIDKSFVQNTADEAIVRAVITLGASLGMEVVAEGVEGPEHFRALKDCGCDHMQGFLFAKPMPADKAAQFIGAFKGQAEDVAAA